MSEAPQSAGGGERTPVRLRGALVNFLLLLACAGFLAAFTTLFAIETLTEGGVVPRHSTRPSLLQGLACVATFGVPLAGVLLYLLAGHVFWVELSDRGIRARKLLGLRVMAWDTVHSAEVRERGKSAELVITPAAGLTLRMSLKEEDVAVARTAVARRKPASMPGKMRGKARKGHG